MTTREHAANLITAALSTATAPTDNAITPEAFAQRFSTALETLGLLQFCDVADPADTTSRSTEQDQRKTEDVQRRDRSDPVT